jgi:acyl-CoA synthetase (AMP-forming)/AMP-acid ligase II
MKAKAAASTGVRPLTLPMRLREQTAASGDHPLLICDDDVLTYADAQTRSAALAKGLLAFGAGKGTRVGLLYPNGADFVVGFMAAARIGAIAVPLSTFSTAPELRDLLRRSDLEILLATETFRRRDFVEALREAVPGLDLRAAPPVFNPQAPALRRIIFSAGAVDRAHTTDALLDAGQGLPDAVLHAVETSVDPADRLVIVHTSGSTSVAAASGQPEPAPSLRRQGNPVFQLAVLLDRWVGVWAARHPAGRGNVGVLEYGWRGGGTRPPRTQ